jgi:polyphosphate kinase
MPRNLFERCEVAFPVRDPAVKARIHDEILPAYLADTVKARIQQPDGTYRRATPSKDGQPFSAQDFLIRLAEGKTDISAMPKLEALTPSATRRPRRPAPAAAAPAVTQPEPEEGVVV